MTNSHEDWARLGRYIAQQVDHLGLQQAEIQARGGPSPAKLRDIIHGRAEGLRVSLRRGLEAVLQWPPGTINNILAGGKPPDGQVGLNNIPLDALFDEIRRRVNGSVVRDNSEDWPAHFGIDAQPGEDVNDPWVSDHLPRSGQG